MSKLKKALKLFISLGLFGIFFSITGVICLYLYLEPRLPEIPEVSVLQEDQLQEPLRIYTKDKRLIAEYGAQRRIPLSLNEIPQTLQQAFIAAEDDRFYRHPGVDWQGILRAGIIGITKREATQGGSTITMQVVRNFFLSNKRTYIRKINEIFLALKIEQQFSKADILQLYLNKIFLGKQAYGVAAAASIYYGKTIDELTLAEMAMIAGLPKAPSDYNPIANPTRAMQRRNYVLKRMLQLGMITENPYQTAIQSPITAKVHKTAIEVEAYYLSEMVRAEIVRMYPKQAYSQGLKVYTTLESAQQTAATLALREGLQNIDRRQGYRGPIQQLDQFNGKTKDFDTERVDQILKNLGQPANLRPALVTDIKDNTASLYFKGSGIAELDFEGVKWAKKHLGTDRLGPTPTKIDNVLNIGDIIWVRIDKLGNLILGQLPEVEGALVALSPQTGAVTALVGGFDYFKSKFNRVTQAQRQAGSSFKPFLYTAALKNNFSAASIINDAPVVFRDKALEGKWKPENYSGRFHGPTRLRVALAKSRNLVSIRLLIELGIPEVRQFAQQFGFKPERLPRDLSLALGSGTVTPLELASAFAVFANGGYKVTPFFIERIENAKGETIFDHKYEPTCQPCPALSEQANPITQITSQSSSISSTEILGEPLISNVSSTSTVTATQRILDPDTVYIARSMLQDVINHGTARRALQLGRTDLAGKTGTTNDQIDAWFSGFNNDLVASVWIGHDSLKTLGKRETGSSAALPIWIDFMKTALSEVPNKQYPQPPNIVSIRIDPTTGLLAHPNQKDAIFEYFRKQNIPQRTAILNQDKSELTTQPNDEETETDELF